MEDRSQVHYYAIAKTPRGEFGQILVTFPKGKMRQVWTGRTFKTQREAEADMVAMNRSASQWSIA